ncbi:MAG TPA: DUF6687 family protein, partial [Acidimicrobiales bacterium]|nr:DUF6687 family protein [Acidimicrobiales bacterium]
MEHRHLAAVHAFGRRDHTSRPGAGRPHRQVGAAITTWLKPRLRRRAGPFRYVPVAELDGRPHVVVDGAPRAGTVCTLSHWPGTPTPPALWADTSAEIVLRALRRPRFLPSEVEVATIDHYDADGVIALGLLLLEDLALAHHELLVGAARAGDFDVVADRDHALVSFALAAMDEDEAARALALLPGLAERVSDFEELWGPEAEAYDRSLSMAAHGAVAIEEHDELDLAVATVDVGHPDLIRAGWKGSVVHRAALHSATTCFRVAT